MLLFFFCRVGAELDVLDGGDDRFLELLLVGVSALQDFGDEGSGLAAEGAQGYLASVTSSEENTFVSDLIDAEANGWVWNSSQNNGFFGPWIGGYQPDGTNWAWTSGESWGYTAWESGQPTNSGGEQNYVHYYVDLSQSQDPTADSPTWNDYSDTADKVFGYVIEYNANPVPVPAASAPVSVILQDASETAASIAPIRAVHSR